MIAPLMPPRRKQDEPPKVTVCGRVKPTTAAELERIAREEWLTVSEVVEQAVLEMIERRRRQKAKAKTDPTPGPTP